MIPRSRRLMRMTLDSKKRKKVKLKKKKKGRRDLFTLHFPSQNLNVVTFE